MKNLQKLFLIIYILITIIVSNLQHMGYNILYCSKLIYARLLNLTLYFLVLTGGLEIMDEIPLFLSSWQTCNYSGWDYKENKADPQTRTCTRNGKLGLLLRLTKFNGLKHKLRC